MSSTHVADVSAGYRAMTEAVTQQSRVMRIYELATSLQVISGSGLDIAHRAAEFRRVTAQRLGHSMPEKYLRPDERSEEATYFLVNCNGETVATSRVVTAEPIADLAQTTFDADHDVMIRQLQCDGQLASIGRLWSSARGDLGAAAGWVTYRALLLDGPSRRPYYVCGLERALRRRLRAIGVECKTVGVSQIPGLNVEPVLFDVHQIIVDVLAADSGFSRFLDDGLEIDLRSDT